MNAEINEVVSVKVEDLKALSECVSTLDTHDLPCESRIVLADKAHCMIGRMLGRHCDSVYEPTELERGNGLNHVKPILTRQSGFSLLELMLVLGISGVVVSAGYIESGDALIASAQNVPTSSLQAAEKMGQCHGLCAEIIAHDKAVKAAWLAQMEAEQIQQ